MLTDTLRTMVNNQFLKKINTNFMKNGKSYQNIIFFFLMLLTVFYISHKSRVKTFLL